MTKKKKTLRVAVLASIFAMAFSATAWAYESSANVNGYTYPTVIPENHVINEKMLIQRQD